MNPNRPRKAPPSWVTERRPNKARKPLHRQPRPDNGERVAELRRLVVDYSIPFARREELAKELAARLRKKS